MLTEDFVRNVVEPTLSHAHAEGRGWALIGVNNEIEPEQVNVIVQALENEGYKASSTDTLILVEWMSMKASK